MRLNKYLINKINKKLGHTKVVQIQKALKRLGLYNSKIDGDYGNGTAKAIYHFQEAHGLIADGIYGRATKKMLFGGKVAKPKRKLSTYKPKNIICKKNFPKEKDKRAMDNFYGKPTRRGTNIRIYELPYPLMYGTFKVTRISLNKHCAKAFLGFFSDLLSYYGHNEIKRLGLDKYAGSFNYRAIRGGNRLSTHSYGCAIDLNAGNNRLRWRRNKALFAKVEYEPMIKIAEAHGLYSLGYSKGYDYMHLQACYR